MNVTHNRHRPTNMTIPVCMLIFASGILSLGCTNNSEIPSTFIGNLDELKGEKFFKNFDAHFTWHNYDPRKWSNLDKVEYLWNGVYVGTGKEGFRNILRNISMMKDEARLLIFPSYEDLFDANELDLSYPFTTSQFQHLMRQLQKKEIVYHFSYRDNTGRLVPHYRNWREQIHNMIGASPPVPIQALQHGRNDNAQREKTPNPVKADGDSIAQDEKTAPQ